ncbi:MAG: shikimate kinase [Oscillospiraceae bacterium]
MKNIVLIGMSGAGKSTLGVLLAKALGLDFVDTDIVLQQRQGRKLQEILDAEGIDAFLRIEEETVCALRAGGSVIATGGSVVYSEKAMAALKSGGRAVYLHVDFPELQRRLGSISTRGIVIKNGCSLEDVYNERLPLYQKYADLTVECTGRGIEACVEEIIRAL